MAYAEGPENAALSGQQKQQNVPARHVLKSIKVVAAAMNYTQWLSSISLKRA